MNTGLLKLAQRTQGGARWFWLVPGFRNGVSFTRRNRCRSRDNSMEWGDTLRWPFRDEKGEALRGVDLDRHRAIAKAEIRRVIKEAQKHGN